MSDDHVGKIVQAEILKLATASFTNDAVYGFSGWESSEVPEKYHLKPVPQTHKLISDSKKYTGFSVYQHIHNDEYCVAFTRYDEQRAKELITIDNAWDRLSTRAIGRRHREHSDSAWKHEIISVHDSKGKAQRAMLKVATKFKTRFDELYAKEVSTEDGMLLKGKLGKNESIGYVGDLVTFTDHTYGQGWLWQIVSEDNNLQQLNDYTILSLKPIWTGMKTTIEPKEKFVPSYQAEPVSIIDLGQSFATLKSLIEQEHKRKSTTRQ